MSGESVLVGGTAWWEPIENPKPELAHLPFGMSFEKSDRLVQAFRVDMFPGALTGFFRFGCTPCASWLFAALGFQLVILFHTPLPAIVAFYKSRQGRIGQVLFLSARECSNCGVARPLITPTTFVSAISFPSYLRHAAAWFSGVSSPRSTTSGTAVFPGRRPRGTGWLRQRGTLENAQLMAAHESPRTTKLYDVGDGGRGAGDEEFPRSRTPSSSPRPARSATKVRRSRNAAVRLAT
jgi:hypothetical protein